MFEFLWEEKMKYKNYVFDLYGTLIDIRTNEYSAYLWKKMQELFAFYGANYKANELKKEYERLCKEEEAKLKKKYDYPEITVEKVLKKLFLNKGVKIDNSTCDCMCRVFRIISTKYIKTYDDTFEALDYIKEKGGRIFLLSNAQNVFTLPEIYYVGLYNYFEGIEISSLDEVRKPSSVFFNNLFEKYGLKKEESVMIGNDWISDIEGANRFGIDSVYLHTNISPQNTVLEEVKATYMIEDGKLSKIKDLLF